MSKKPPPSWSSQDYQEACEWFVEFRTDTPDTARRETFHAWLQQSPAHMGAYLEATAVWNHTSILVPGDKYSIEALVAAASEESDNVRRLDRGAISTNAGPLRKSRRGLYVAIAASFALLLVGSVAVLLWGPSQTYVTAIGEQRSVVLKDGSIIELNSRSRVAVRYTDHDRDIQLLNGQALFRVAHDTRRPFIVKAGDTAVRAVGTQFDVNRLATETVVTVLEGKVSVEPSALSSIAEPNVGASTNLAHPDKSRPGVPDPSVLVAAGEQLRVVRGEGIRAARPDVAAATAWTQRRLVFDGTPLADVVEEFNRYNARPLHLLNPGLGSFQVDGVFSSTDPEPMIRFLRTRPGIMVTETETAIDIDEK